MAGGTPDYHEQRASQEAEAAEAANCPEAATAHRQLSAEYEHRAKTLRSEAKLGTDPEVKSRREKLTLGYGGHQKGN